MKLFEGEDGGHEGGGLAAWLGGRWEAKCVLRVELPRHGGVHAIGELHPMPYSLTLHTLTPCLNWWKYVWEGEGEGREDYGSPVRNTNL